MREIAVRAALGASRGDLIRYSLMESFLIALTGTIMGVILSQWITEFAVSYAPLLPRREEIAIDNVVLAFAVGICVLTTILFGSLPSWRASRVDPLEALSSSGRGNTDSLRVGRVRAALIAAEVALGTVLVIGSGLLLMSFYQAMNRHRGFDGHDVVIVDLPLPSPKYRALEKQISFFRAALGADRQHISRMVFRNGLMPVVVGLPIGLFAAGLFARLMSSLLLQVRALDPATFIVAPLVLLVAAAAPCWLTARRAAHIDPMDCLRLE